MTQQTSVPLSRTARAPRPHAPAWLLSRATFGYTPDDEASILALGHQGWVNAQLQPTSIPDPDVDALLQGYPWLSMTPHEVLADPGISPFEVAREYKFVRLARAVLTRRQLFERVVEFWSDHFSVFMGRFMRVYDDESVWRPHALGTFRELLRAVTRSASMIAFLDGDENVAGAANENLAREIFELHTLGVDGPYTETDVREFARCLTGWTFRSDAADTSFGEFEFRWADHDAGPKTVLGLSFPGGGGPADVDAVLDLVAEHPSTIEFVTRKLARWFLGEPVPDARVAAAVEAWTSSGGSIRRVVDTLLSPSALASVESSGTTKFRRPFDWLTAVLRATRVPLPDSDAAHSVLGTLGQRPFEWPAPDGYPDDAARWAQLVQPRWDVASKFARPGTAGVDLWNHSSADLLALVTLPGGALAPRSRWARRLNQRLTGGRLSEVDVEQIQGHIDFLTGSTPDAAVLGEALELSFSCPSFQVI